MDPPPSSVCGNGRPQDFHLFTPIVGKKVSGKIDHFTFSTKTYVPQAYPKRVRVVEFSRTCRYMNKPKFGDGNGMVIITGWKATIGW